MAKKTLINIGIAVAVDTSSPPGMGKGSILSIGASNGKFDFEVNLIPKNGEVEKRKFWTTNPLLWEKVTSNPIPIEEGLGKFERWLQEFQSSIPFAVGGGWDFWWLYQEMRKWGGGCPFEGRWLDIGGFLMGRKGISSLQGYKWNLPQVETPLEKAKKIISLLEKEGVRGKVLVGKEPKRTIWDNPQELQELFDTPPPTRGTIPPGIQTIRDGQLGNVGGLGTWAAQNVAAQMENQNYINLTPIPPIPTPVPPVRRLVLRNVRPPQTFLQEEEEV